MLRFQWQLNQISPYPPCGPSFPNSYTPGYQQLPLQYQPFGYQQFPPVNHQPVQQFEYYSHPPSVQPSHQPSIQPTLETSANPNLEDSVSQPLPLSNVSSSACLLSSEIAKDKLIPVEATLLKYPKLKGDSKAGTLACKLAKESIFGNDVMKKCTPLGNKHHPGLPTAELFELKKIMFRQFKKSSIEFEEVWKRCLESIQQACKRLRSGTDS